MNPIYFPGSNTIIAKDQPPYRALPAYVAQDGCVLCCWKLTWRERFSVLVRGLIWHQIHTFNKPLQPQSLTTKEPYV